jgi:hypothetical protein
MAMPEAPENYEWEVSLGNAGPGFRARAFVRMQPKHGHFGDTGGFIYGPVPVYDEGLEAIEAVAAQMVIDQKLADAGYAQREQTAREWAEALGCKVTA